MKNPIREATIIRIIDAPRELVFKAFTDEKMLEAWWGPHHFENKGTYADPKVGGEWGACMYSTKLGFLENWCRGVYTEISYPDRLVFTVRAFINENDEEGVHNVNTLTLEDLGGKTKLTLHVEIIKLAEFLQAAADGMEEGWSQSLEKLNSMLQKRI